MTPLDGAPSGTRKDLANYRLQCAEAQLEFATEFVAAIKAYCEQRQ